MYPFFCDGGVSNQNARTIPLLAISVGHVSVNIRVQTGNQAQDINRLFGIGYTTDSSFASLFVPIIFSINVFGSHKRGVMGTEPVNYHNYYGLIAACNSRLFVGLTRILSNAVHVPVLNTWQADHCLFQFHVNSAWNCRLFFLVSPRTQLLQFSFSPYWKHVISRESGLEHDNVRLFHSIYITVPSFQLLVAFSNLHKRRLSPSGAAEQRVL